MPFTIQSPKTSDLRLSTLNFLSFNSEISEKKLENDEAELEEESESEPELEPDLRERYDLRLAMLATGLQKKI